MRCLDPVSLLQAVGWTSIQSLKGLLNRAILVTIAGYKFRISLKKLKGNVHTYAVLTVKLQSCDITFDFNDIHNILTISNF